MKKYSLLALVIFICINYANADNQNVSTLTFELTTGPWTSDLNDTGGHGGHGVHLASWNFAYVSGPLAISLFVMLAGLLKLGFHYASFLSSIVPESCVLIAIGTIMGVFFYFVFDPEDFRLTPRAFLLFLLPPIVLESAYSLNDRVFMQNLGTILLYAVVGTILSFLMVGSSMYGLAVSGAMGPIKINIVQCFLYASFIVAVDPVAVLAIFQEVGVNNVLYFLVFGESLLNDAVTVVLSNMMKAFVEMDEIPVSQIVKGIASFFTISLGGLAIGIIMGVITSLITRTTQHVRVVEPLAIIIFAYLSYLVAELFHWSGIISMIGCGLVQSEYAFHNISRKSHITVEYFIKMLASVQDAIIFLFLGLEMIRIRHEWHTGFVLWGLLLCLVFRAVTTFGLTFIVNRVDRTHPIKYEEQFIMWYGGLRGAVCFALCDTINDDFEHKEMFLTATFFIIMFTVFVQGITIKPLVGLCRITRKSDSSGTLIEELQMHMNDHIMSGIEVVIDQTGQNFFRSWFSKMNEKYFRKWLQNDPLTREQQILAVYKAVTIEEYQDALKQGLPAPGVSRHGPMEQAPGFGPGEPGFAISPGPPISPTQLETMPEFTGVADTSILRRRKTAGTLEKFGPGRRKSVLDQLTRNFHSDDVTKVEGFRQLLKDSISGSVSFHRRYDPDLVHGSHSDIASQLSERHARVSRYQSSVLRRTRTLSQTSQVSHGFFSRQDSAQPALASDYFTEPRQRQNGSTVSLPKDVNIEMQLLGKQKSPAESFTEV